MKTQSGWSVLAAGCETVMTAVLCYPESAPAASSIEGSVGSALCCDTIQQERTMQTEPARLTDAPVTTIILLLLILLQMLYPASIQDSELPQRAAGLPCHSGGPDERGDRLLLSSSDCEVGLQIASCAKGAHLQTCRRSLVASLASGWARLGASRCVISCCLSFAFKSSGMDVLKGCSFFIAHYDSFEVCW